VPRQNERAESSILTNLPAERQDKEVYMMLGILLLIGIVIGIVLILPLPKGKREEAFTCIFLKEKK